MFLYPGAISRTNPQMCMDADWLCAMTRPGLKVAGLIGLNPLKGVGGLGAISHSVSDCVPLVNNTQLARGFEPGVGWRHMANTQICAQNHSAN